MRRRRFSAQRPANEKGGSINRLFIKEIPMNISLGDALAASLQQPGIPPKTNMKEKP
jgi:hypothetical protein